MTTLDTLIDYKQLVEALADAVIVADPSGVIRFWNLAAERLFGFTEAQTLSHSLDLIVPERERHWAGYNNTMATGQSRYARDVLREVGCSTDLHKIALVSYLNSNDNPSNGTADS